VSALLYAMAAITCAALASRAYRALHMLQLDGYMVDRYARHSRERVSWRDAAPSVSVHIAALLLGAAGAAAGISWAAYVVVAAWAVQTAVLSWRVWARPPKKPFVMTARMGRLVGATSVLTAAVGALAVCLLEPVLGRMSAPAAVAAAYAAAGLLVVLEPLVVAAGVVAVEPLEMLVRRRFLSAARRRLGEVGPLVIGIAGSYGKTTTKSALAAALSKRFRVLASPESYNTLLGVARTINELLADDTEVLIVEMGARGEGDIAEICDLVRPTVGIITRLGPQHLEYFRSEDAVVRAKTELLRALPRDGLAVADADGLSDFLQADGWTVPVIRVSTRKEAGPDALVHSVSIGADGTRFTADLPGGGRLEARTPLLGRHVAIDCSLAAVAAHKLGVEPDDIAAGLRSMPTVPHRLEVVRNDSVVVIDDAYNSNPDGFAAALEVLGSIDGRHILVTPGMVELGAGSVAAHQRVAAIAARVCDVVILVGGSAPKEFAASLLAGGLPAGGLIPASDLADATATLGRLVRSGDVVLFENDLPDNFR
jgi:UDP-N-acetylmuramoyl-tripeptide--D-alanyl-D-alanine ligase